VPKGAGLRPLAQDRGSAWSSAQQIARRNPDRLCQPSTVETFGSHLSPSYPHLWHPGNPSGADEREGVSGMKIAPVGTVVPLLHILKQR